MDLRAEACEVLTDALGWRMSEPGWERVAELLVMIEDAVTRDSAADLEAATAELELLGPLRIIRIGTRPAAPPPPVRDLLNRLVHVMGGPVIDESRDR